MAGSLVRRNPSLRNRPALAGRLRSKPPVASPLCAMTRQLSKCTRTSSPRGLENGTNSPSTHPSHTATGIRTPVSGLRIGSFRTSTSATARERSAASGSRPPARRRSRSARALLLQLSTNLVHNAIVHNLPEDGIVWVSTSARADVVELAVENTGETLAPEMVPTLAEPFPRAASIARSPAAPASAAPLAPRPPAAEPESKSAPGKPSKQRLTAAPRPRPGSVLNPRISTVVGVQVVWPSPNG